MMIISKISSLKPIRSILIVFMASFLLSSCVSNKKYVYMQDRGNLKTDSNGIARVQPYVYILQKGDILYISLTTEDEQLNKLFVPNGAAGGGMVMQQGQSVSGTPFYFIGYSIDKDGFIEFPYMGKVKVGNRTLEDAKLEIENQLKKYFKVFILQVKIAEFKFSVIGYVNKPGQFFFQQNKVTIFEAISLAGDLQNLAKRYEVQLYRQFPEGVKVINIDLTDRSIINSPYWYIQPNDVLYVVPLKARAIGDVSSLQSSFGVVAPLLSMMLLVLNTYILVKNL
jgi:polysaccharide export outer membrane protein